MKKEKYTEEIKNLISTRCYEQYRIKNTKLKIMLQPREKASELMKKIVSEIEYICRPSIVQMVAKRLAVVTIDEIIKELNQECEETQALLYWEEVRIAVMSF